MTRRSGAQAVLFEGGAREPATLQRVVVSLHGRRAPLAAIRLGRLVAGALHVPLHGLFAWSAPIPAAEVPRMLRLRPEVLEGLVLDVHVGEAGDQLEEFGRAHPSHYLVVTAEPDASGPLGLGPPAMRALGSAPLGVLIVREDAELPERIERILLPLDGTPSTAGAIAPVGELAREAGAALDIVYVGTGGRETPVHPEEPGSMRTPRYVDQPQHEWSAFSDEFLQRFLLALGHCPPEVSTRMFLGAGNPGGEILRFARELASDIIALVWGGELLNHHQDVFRQVVREATCPLLILNRRQAGSPGSPGFER